MISSHSVKHFIYAMGLGCVGALFGPASHAGPWIAPGDSALRHDIQVLADAGVILAPVSTWPLSSGDIAAALADPGDDLTAYEMAALARVRRAMDIATNTDGIGWNADVSLAANPRQFRTFEDGPREDGEIGIGFEWTGDWFAANLQGKWIDNPQDGDEWRADDSYVGIALGNWMLAGAITDRWWGPGWQTSLIMSSNARPIPAITLERNSTAAFETKWLSWLGSWDLMVMYGLLEDDRVVSNARIFGMRFNFRPLKSLEIGLSRTAMLCGDDRQCSFKTHLDMLLGNDNVGFGVSADDEPGNQLGGFDIRWAAKAFGQPFALYTQWIGEDENNYFPTQWMGQFGGETWGRWDSVGNYRFYFEWSDTTCDFTAYRSIRGDDDPANGGCAYNHPIYKSGYRYKGRNIGSSFDGDSSVFAFGSVLNDNSDHSWLANVAFGDLNRHVTSTPNPVAMNKTRYREVEVRHRRAFWIGELDLGVGYVYTKDEVTAVSTDEFRAFFEWGVKY